MFLSAYSDQNIGIGTKEELFLQLPFLQGWMQSQERYLFYIIQLETLFLAQRGRFLSLFLS